MSNGECCRMPIWTTAPFNNRNIQPQPLLRAAVAGNPCPLFAGALPARMGPGRQIDRERPDAWPSQKGAGHAGEPDACQEPRATSSSKQYNTPLDSDDRLLKTDSTMPAMQRDFQETVDVTKETLVGAQKKCDNAGLNLCLQKAKAPLSGTRLGGFRKGRHAEGRKFRAAGTPVAAD